MPAWPTVEFPSPGLDSGVDFVDLVDTVVADQIRDRAASRLTGQDSSLFGTGDDLPLAWTAPFGPARTAVSRAADLAGALRAEGINRLVLLGMGGSSLAAGVVAKWCGVALTVLDTTDPARVLPAMAADPRRTLVVVSSKSGRTIETDALRRSFEEWFTGHGFERSRHFAAITDHGSVLQDHAVATGYREVFTCAPRVGGRYSALTAFGLVPAALLGANVLPILRDAEEAAVRLGADTGDNPALRLAAALRLGHQRGDEKVFLTGGPPGFGEWVEQLIAESTGKDGIGLLPVLDGDAPGAREVITAAIDGRAIRVTGRLGALFLLWEYAIAFTGRLLGVDPFDQPDVEAAKHATLALLETGGVPGGPEPTLEDGPIAAWMLPADPVHGARTVHEALAWVARRAAGDGGYVALQAFLDDAAEHVLGSVRRHLEAIAEVPVTLGWGPRYLHSTGQYHKGGHQNGAFVQVTGAVREDVAVAGKSYTLGQLQGAQALADGRLVSGLGRPLLRLHLTDRAAGLRRLGEALKG